ncbi:energy-coupling factor transporter transmembrane protein EcfT [Caldibacillus lycopersici]|uniref:Energy-coupling factor transporter transmembrane protein EcfT n=1 Tax=Perspicuibacillus lycopersici TaxID=1325689 RepID=A0AAE3LT22_9BACI|nr:energy-coupling factor transporter transmembrane component T [Perspicuibacillus lycopersici]MCU9613393.1 energy-coupling factor transporter transmembrane protein EcfT [Perspicuibacillus lycopersici]
MKRGFRSLHPLVCLIYFIAAFTTLMLYQHPFFLVFTIILLLCFHWALDRWRLLRGWGKMFMILPILFFIITPLINHRGNHLLFYLFNNPITLEAIMQGWIHSLSLLAMLLLFMSFNLVITADKFLFLFSRGFPQWSLLIMLSMRFIPLLRRRLNEIITVQKSRGLSTHDGRFRQRIKNGLLLLQILLTWSLEEGIQTADSMAARGYGLQKRSRYIPYKMKLIDGISIIFLLILTILCLFGWWLGDGVLALTPILEPIFLYGREWTFFFLYIVLIGYPLIMEIREQLLWHSWKQKI